MVVVFDRSVEMPHQDRNFVDWLLFLSFRLVRRVDSNLIVFRNYCLHQNHQLQDHFQVDHRHQDVKLEVQEVFYVLQFFYLIKFRHLKISFVRTDQLFLPIMFNFPFINFIH
mgnify:CR=1 FL=1